MSIKKIKFENNFNIIRELYLNKENRNLLNGFLKYLNRGSRIIFMVSILNGPISICENCYKDTKTFRTDCNYGSLFCQGCLYEHFDKYSRYSWIHPGIRNISMKFNHQCDLALKEISREISFHKFIAEFTNVEKIKSNLSSAFYD